LAGFASRACFDGAGFHLLRVAKGHPGPGCARPPGGRRPGIAVPAEKLWGPSSLCANGVVSPRRRRIRAHPNP
jgi:hypothetical protein